MPDGVERVRIDPKSGLRAYEGMQDAIDEVFVAGTAPTATALPPDMLDSGSFVMEQLGGLGAQGTAKLVGTAASYATRSLVQPRGITFAYGTPNFVAWAIALVLVPGRVRADF